MSDGNGVTVPSSWLKGGAPLIVGLLLGGGGVTGVDLMGARAMDREEFQEWQALHEATTHDGSATAVEITEMRDQIQDLIFIVCQLADAQEPPIKDRRCQTD